MRIIDDFKLSASEGATLEVWDDTYTSEDLVAADMELSQADTAISVMTKCLEVVEGSIEMMAAATPKEAAAITRVTDMTLEMIGQSTGVDTVGLESEDSTELGLEGLKDTAKRIVKAIWAVIQSALSATKKFFKSLFSVNKRKEKEIDKKIDELEKIEAEEKAMGPAKVEAAEKREAQARASAPTPKPSPADKMPKMEKAPEPKAPKKTDMSAAPAQPSQHMRQFKLPAKPGTPSPDKITLPSTAGYIFRDGDTWNSQIVDDCTALTGRMANWKKLLKIFTAKDVPPETVVMRAQEELVRLTGAKWVTSKDKDFERHEIPWLSPAGSVMISFPTGDMGRSSAVRLNATSWESSLRKQGSSVEIDMPSLGATMQMLQGAKRIMQSSNKLDMVDGLHSSLNDYVSSYYDKSDSELSDDASKAKAMRRAQHMASTVLDTYRHVSRIMLMITNTISMVSNAVIARRNAVAKA